MFKKYFSSAPYPWVWAWQSILFLPNRARLALKDFVTMKKNQGDYLQSPGEKRDYHQSIREYRADQPWRYCLLGFKGSRYRPDLGSVT